MAVPQGVQRELGEQQGSADTVSSHLSKDCSQRVLRSWGPEVQEQILLKNLTVVMERQAQDPTRFQRHTWIELWPVCLRVVENKGEKRWVSLGVRARGGEGSSDHY